MAYDDEQARRSRVVVETPTSRREVTQTDTVRNDRGGRNSANNDRRSVSDERTTDGYDQCEPG
jgi:hypothetical protein